MHKPSAIPGHWLKEQALRGRQCVLVINPMARPDPLASLFAVAPINEYIRLYQGTAFDALAALGPWLVRADADSVKAVNHLLGMADPQWGWFASAEQLDLNALAAHWRARMVIPENSQRWLYRFHDNLVIARHLQGLEPEQLPLLLGPLASALCWDGEQWRCFDNPRPGIVAEPFDRPWLRLAQPQEQQEQALLAHLQDWLWENHAEATQRLLQSEALSPWLEYQLAQARARGWPHIEDLYFQLEWQLDPELANHSVWQRKPGETPDMHMGRCLRDLPGLRRRNTP